VNQDLKIRFKHLSTSTWPEFADRVMEIEEACYEPARRDSREFLEAIVHAPRSIVLLCIARETVLGFCFGAPLELFSDVEGTKTDPEWNKGSTLYSADVTVSLEYRNRGIGYELKKEQIRVARELGYRFIAGRNRVGLASSMISINVRLGAYQIKYLVNSYPDDLPHRDCIYYHINLAPSSTANPE
jgi:predicted GNAT superfamily acetyltransferase